MTLSGQNMKRRRPWVVIIGIFALGYFFSTSMAGGDSAPKMEDYATIEAYSDDVPVYAFGFMYVYGVSPDFLRGTVLQTGNTNPRAKIQPKKSWELKENKMGSTPAGVPRSAVNDHQPFRSIHLIDGDVETSWCSRPQMQPDVEDVWIRIDLPREQQIRSVVLTPHPAGQVDHDEVENVLLGQAFPRQLTIKLSCDAWHWETVYENKRLSQPKKMVPQKFEFNARPAKQVWIIGREFPQVMLHGHCFSIAEVEVNDTSGNNKALISQGAAVTVSSTYHGYGTDRLTQEMLWPIQYDLGFKWTRVGYGKDMFTRASVERIKGVYQLDPGADAAITECAHNGVNVLMCLNKGTKWLFVKEPKVFDKARNAWVFPEFWEPTEPTRSEEDLQGYLKYVRFMVRHFKDRVKYFEVWNEWDEGAEEYCKFFPHAIRVIREECPDAKVVITPTAPEESAAFILGVLNRVGPIFDVVSLHPWYNPDPTRKDFLEYPVYLRNLKKDCAARGFKGEYMVTEWTYSAPYPQPPEGIYENNKFKISEIQKAKYAARLTVTHQALNVYSFWNELFQQQVIQWSIGLLRNSFSASPLSPTQPEPVYYIMRTLSTVMDEVTPTEVKVQFSPVDKRLEWYTLRKPDGELMLAAWLNGYAKDDDSQEIISDVTFPDRKLSKVSVIDILNGDMQSLNVSLDGNRTIIKDMHIKDWPIIITGRQ